jgi:HPt (histidine-containing phosphotransfer) domain-containing protein
MKKSKELIELEKIAGNKASEKRKLLEIFIKQTTKQLSQINSCLVKKDWMELKRIAHSMKSTFLHIKMKRAIELTELIRTTAGENIRVTKEQVNELIIICSPLLEEFSRELKTEF